MAPRPPRRRRPTITDVAAEAGVAASTVSRALSNPGRVNLHTREHVLAVAERLGYAPNPTAQALESGRSRTIAMVVPDITNPFFAGFIRGAEHAASAAGLTLMLGDSHENPAAEEQIVRRLGRVVDGFLLTASRLPDRKLTEAAALAPVVLVNRASPGLPCVVADYDHGTRQIVGHLASWGHRAVTYLGGPAESWSGARRWAGLQAAAEASGLTATRFGPYSPTLASGAAAADSVLAAGATAVVAHNDLLAIGVLNRLAERGVRVPEQVSVVGFDNVFGSEFCHPPLTTLAERTEEMAARAVESLIALGPGGGDPATPARVLPTQLVIRASTGPAPATSAGRPGG